MKLLEERRERLFGGPPAEKRRGVRQLKARSAQRHAVFECP
jgi:hypothetical protein